MNNYENDTLGFLVCCINVRKILIYFVFFFLCVFFIGLSIFGKLLENYLYNHMLMKIRPTDGWVLNKGGWVLNEWLFRNVCAVYHFHLHCIHMIRLPRCQWRNPEKIWLLYHTNPQETDKYKHKQCAYLIGSAVLRLINKAPVKSLINYIQWRA